MTARKQPAEDPFFEEAWRLYPKRPNNNKNDARKAWDARIKEGFKPSELIAGTVAYAQYVLQEKTAPNYIKQASTFFGPGCHFLNDYAQQTMPLDDREVGLQQFNQSERVY